MNFWYESSYSSFGSTPHLASHWEKNSLMTNVIKVMMWKIVPPHIWGAFVVFGWGIIATLQAASTSWSGMMVCRFFLGAIEAGYGTGIPYLLSFFYLRHEVGLRIGLFVSAAPLANTFAGALAYGITSGHSKLANWRLLFLVEGIPTLLMVPVTFFCLPDSPEQAKYLTEEEKLVAKARGVRQAGSAHRVGGIQWKEVGLALADPKCWITAVRVYYPAVYITLIQSSSCISQ